MRQLAALLVLVPLSALSQSTEPQSPSPLPGPVVAAPAPVTPGSSASPAASAVAAEAPRWSIGAALLVDPVVIMTTTAGGIYEVRSPPGVAASLERRLSDRSWLVVDLSGRAARYRWDVASGGFDTTKEDTLQLEVSAGLRRRVTPGAAPVDVSLLALASAGVLSTESTTEQFSGPVEDRTRLAWSAGADLGLAVERELVDGISLRVATPLVGVAWTWVRAEIEGESPQEGYDVTLAVALAPRIELRIAF